MLPVDALLVVSVPGLRDSLFRLRGLPHLLPDDRVPLEPFCEEPDTPTRSVRPGSSENSVVR